MCYNININLEILKAVVYFLINSDKSAKKIALFTGKNASFIYRTAKELDVNISPITKNFYLNYENRIKNFHS